VIVCCSVVMSYPWANDLVYRISGNELSKIVAAPQAAARTQDSRSATTIDVEGLNELCAAAERKTANWRTVSLRLPRASDATAVFSIDAGNGGQPEKRAQLTLNRKSAKEVRWEPFESYNQGRRWRMWIRFTHTGEDFGLMGQGVAELAALGGSFFGVHRDFRGAAESICVENADSRDPGQERHPQSYPRIRADFPDRRRPWWFEARSLQSKGAIVAFAAGTWIALIGRVVRQLPVLLSSFQTKTATAHAHWRKP